MKYSSTKSESWELPGKRVSNTKCTASVICLLLENYLLPAIFVSFLKLIVTVYLVLLVRDTAT